MLPSLFDLAEGLDAPCDLQVAVVVDDSEAPKDIPSERVSVFGLTLRHGKIKLGLVF